MRLYLLVLISVISVMAATNKVNNCGERFFSVKLFVGDGSGSPDTVYLDSAESDTATDIWDISNCPRYAADDILGTFSLVCADSSGTDSLDVEMYIQGNLTDGASGEQWTTIDSISSTSDDGTANLGVDTVKSEIDYSYLRFILKQKGQEAAEKPKCYNMRWSKRKEGRLVQ